MATEDDELRWIRKIKNLCSDSRKLSTTELCSQLVAIRKQRLVSPERFRTHLLDRVLITLLAALANSKPYDTIELLHALNATINGHGAYCSKHYDALLAILLPLARPTNDTGGCRRQAINCLGNLCQRTGNKMHNYMEEIQNVLLDNLEIILEDVRRLNERQWLESPKLASCTLRAMQLVLAEEKPNQLQSDRLMRVLPNFALLHYEDRVNVYPFRLVADTRAVVTSSESEFSESESSISGKRDRVRIRQHALQCIQQLAKISTAVVFTHLDRLFQGGQQTGRRTLLMAILEEETTELRITACSVLMTIISYGKSYFATASERVSQISSFISLSEKMGVLLRQFHTTLIAALQRESDASFTVSILQCASVLANSVPYERLSSVHLLRLFDAVFQCTNRHCSTIVSLVSDKQAKPMTNEQISSHASYLPAINGLACLATLIDAVAIESHVKDTPDTPVPDSLQSTRSALLEKMNATFDLVQTCFNLVEVQQELTSKGYTIISAMIRTFPDFISARWTVINATLQSAQLPKECEARVAALNTVEQFAKTVAIDTTWCIWWENTIDQIIQANCSDSVGSIRTVVCDILASLKNDVFEGLTMQRQRFIQSLMLSLSSDTRPMVQAAACRALGVFVLFPSLRDDLLFLSDATNAVLSHVIDRNLDVKLRVFWTVANICDLWVENSNIKTALLTKEMYLQVGKAILNGASDNVKIRPHAIRAIGSLILAADELVMGAPAQLRDMVEVVCSNVKTGPLKVRWNACHTLSKMVRNVHFPMGQADWTCMMIDTLCGAIDQTRNYKVRIHACVAIRALPERGSFGQHTEFVKVVNTIVKALKTATIMEDTKFTEYKYLNQLQQQLNDCGEYLLSMATKEDQLQLSENLRVLQSLLTTSSTSDI